MYRALYCWWLQFAQFLQRCHPCHRLVSFTPYLVAHYLYQKGFIDSVDKPVEFCSVDDLSYSALPFASELTCVVHPVPQATMTPLCCTGILLWIFCNLFHDVIAVAVVVPVLTLRCPIVLGSSMPRHWVTLVVVCALFTGYPACISFTCCHIVFCWLQHCWQWLCP